jgi:predicted DNA-binding protein
MSRYTTIRVSIEEKQRLERLARLTGKKSLTEALRFALTVAEKELERVKVDPGEVLSSLTYARDVGDTNAEKVDEYLYGVSE